jgi:hypothetical protein
MTLEFFRNIFEKSPNIRVSENLCFMWTGRWTDGRTDGRPDRGKKRRRARHAEVNSRSSQFFERNYNAAADILAISGGVLNPLCTR